MSKIEYRAAAERFVKELVANKDLKFGAIELNLSVSIINGQLNTLSDSLSIKETTKL